VPSAVLNPRNTWENKKLYDIAANKLAASFIKNFEQYASAANEEIMSAAPKIEEPESPVLILSQKGRS